MTDLQTLIDAARRWRDEIESEILPHASEDEWQGYRNEADQITEAIEAAEKDTSINVYFTGDEDGPNLFGVVYDDEDSVLEAAHENDVQGWRVPVQPLLDRAVLLDGNHDD